MAEHLAESMVEWDEDLGKAVMAERAKTAALLKHAKRLVRFGFNQTEVDGIISNPALDLSDAIAAYEERKE